MYVRYELVSVHKAFTNVGNDFVSVGNSYMGM